MLPVAHYGHHGNYGTHLCVSLPDFQNIEREAETKLKINLQQAVTVWKLQVGF